MCFRTGLIAERVTQISEASASVNWLRGPRSFRTCFMTVISESFGIRCHAPVCPTSVTLIACCWLRNRSNIWYVDPHQVTMYSFSRLLSPLFWNRKHFIKTITQSSKQKHTSLNVYCLLQNARTLPKLKIVHQKRITSHLIRMCFHNGNFCHHTNTVYHNNIYFLQNGLRH